MAFWNNEQEKNLDVTLMTSDSFEKFTQGLHKIPESNWGQGRREPILQVIEKHNQLHPESVEFIRPEYEPSKFYTIIKFSIGKEDYIYFEDISIIMGKPRIQWFQLEKIDKSLGENMYRTKLLLSSDDNAKTQGGIMLLLFEEYKSKK